MRIGQQVFIVLALVLVVAFGVWVVKQTGQGGKDNIPLDAASFDAASGRSMNLTSSEDVVPPRNSETSRTPSGSTPPALRPERRELRNPSPVEPQPPASTPTVDPGVGTAPGGDSGGNSGRSPDPASPDGGRTALPPALPPDPPPGRTGTEPGAASSEIERPTPPADPPAVRPEPKTEAGTELKTAPPVEPPAAPDRTHAIVENDTFSSLAKQYYGDEGLYHAIELANPTLDPRRLFVGAKVRIPTAEQARALLRRETTPKPESKPETKPETRPVNPAPGGTKIYVVEQNDSLAKIARALLGSPDAWEQIYELNKDQISPPDYVIRAGMRLKLPASAGQATSRPRP